MPKYEKHIHIQVFANTINAEAIHKLCRPLTGLTMPHTSSSMYDYAEMATDIYSYLTSEKLGNCDTTAEKMSTASG
jgi:hypothetical protein